MDQVEALQRKILDFYEKQGRSLPWRKTTDRYKVLVSEIMLQQTQVDRVTQKYEAWIKRFPTAKALAEAPLSDVLKLWSGLGYNNRAKRLHDAAKKVVEESDGEIPDDEEDLKRLPGIGPYTARSVLIFADNRDLATVDTNIRRILIHELGLPETTTEKELFDQAEKLLPKGRSRDWHNALMDYGALHLTSRKSGIRPKTRQSRFQGSKRQVRSTLLKHALERGSVTEQEAEELFPDTEHDVKGILEDLEKEGLLEKGEKDYKIKSD
ncbi:Fe-S cluster assembly protein HesB [Candidatus Woesearchaeota archaeon]|nr:Fe-S cluster assembly protein HesB [Candidatus Woesearchaeota archaeon]